jgi:TolB protein
MIQTITRRRWPMALAAALAVGLQVVAQQEITISDKVAGFVPIALAGFSGEVEQVLRFDLEVAGFNVVSPDKARFTLSGKNDGQVEGTLTDASKRSIFARAYPGATARSQAHALSDDVVQATTGQKGIARTKIAFKIDTGRRNERNESVSEIFLADYDGANPFQLTRDGTIARSPAWQPGHRVLLYSSFRLGRSCIYSHDLGSGARLPVASFNGMNDGAAIAPDGSRLAMILSKSGSPDVWVGNVDGSGLRQLTTTREDESSPCWSPDGRTLCFTSRAEGATRLYVIDANGGNMRPLNTGGVRGATEPDWSPDGKWIAFTRMAGRENFQVYVVAAGGGEAQMVGEGEDPTWAPNSRTLAVVRRKGGTRRLSLLDAPTRRVKDSASFSGSCSQPSWAR